MSVTDIWGVLHEITYGDAPRAEPGNIAPLDREPSDQAPLLLGDTDLLPHFPTL